MPLALATTLAASTALSGCGNSGSSTTIRDGYTSLDDCVKDWGSADKCQRPPGSTGGSSHGGSGVSHYYGPSYSEGGREAAQRSATGSSTSGNHAVSRSVSSISRGGFGGSAHGSSGGG
ncbi:hypothetical protein GCM10011396_19650 [Undibacterium terreum]|uniref:Uncharacterized protein n=1 Tax=Undibacterium terreum TaxID=1224302 RepID=A0A916UHX6_9BURK|nr:hypothetical protein GCM10011396_19650 [Undibacterium terreum]